MDEKKGAGQLGTVRSGKPRPVHVAAPGSGGHHRPSSRVTFQLNTGHLTGERLPQTAAVSLLSFNAVAMHRLIDAIDEASSLGRTVIIKEKP